MSLPTFVLSCKSKAPEPKKVTCPDGFWKVPDEWKCSGINHVDCANDYRCMNYASLCDGKRSLSRRDPKVLKILQLLSFKRFGV